ncbi:MAG: hypothetical protein V1901_04160 [Patescibacteria group bacterium]
MIKTLKLHNLGLFKDQEFNFEKINIISGLNYDEPEPSGNGCAKSTILNSILFAKYGDVPKKTILDLLRNNTKSGYVELTEEENNNIYTIKREIPTNLNFSINGIADESNTNTLKQEVLNKIFGDKDHFLKFRLIDNKKGINILDLGITSLRNTMMELINTKFDEIRQRLLDKKNDREKYNKSKRLYQFCLSERRLKILEEESKNFISKLASAQIKLDEQQKIVNKIKINISTNENNSNLLYNKIKETNNRISKGAELIKNYNNKIDVLNVEPKKESIVAIDYSQEIKDNEITISDNDVKLKENNEDKEISNDRLQSLTIDFTKINNELKQIKLQKKELLLEIEGLNDVKIGTVCDKCGSLVTESHREGYRKEKLNKLEELEIKENLLKIDYDDLELEIDRERNNLKIVNNEISKLQESTFNLRTYIKDLNNRATKQTEELNTIENVKSKKQSEIEKYLDLILTANTQIQALELENKETKINIEQLCTTVEQYKSNLINEEEIYSDYHSEFIDLEALRRRTQDYLMKLKEAFKFSEYKYTTKDVFIYSEAIKTLDNFASYFINHWLSSLEVIINNLLFKINISVEFSADKEFLKIRNGDQDLRFSQLSDGQNIFLSAVFKLAILLNNGETSGVILIDEGASSLDLTNLKKLINICQELPFQVFLIYQNVNKTIENVNFINIERRNGESKLCGIN